MSAINELRQSLGAVQPEEVAELLARREVAEKARDALRATIDSMDPQKPVASVWRCDNGHIHGSCERPLPMGAKLYAFPGAKGE